MQRFPLLFLATLSILLSACAHPITINPSQDSFSTISTEYSEKIVGYVMTDIDRTREVTTAGGGGDKISYFPYKDLEKGLRDALKALYKDVFAVASPMDSERLQRDGIQLIYSPEIHTVSDSDSLFTWPPTNFSVDIASAVTDPNGNQIARFEVSGQGQATFSEFTSDFGLAGRRAAQDALEKFTAAVRNNEKLK